MLNRLKSSMEMTENRISEPEDRTIEFTQSAQQGENRLKKTNKLDQHRLRDSWTITKDSTFSQRERRECS